MCITCEDECEFDNPMRKPKLLAQTHLALAQCKVCSLKLTECRQLFNSTRMKDNIFLKEILKVMGPMQYF